MPPYESNGDVDIATVTLIRSTMDCVSYVFDVVESDRRLQEMMDREIPEVPEEE